MLAFRLRSSTTIKRVTEHSHCGGRVPREEHTLSARPRAVLDPPHATALQSAGKTTGPVQLFLNNPIPKLSAQALRFLNPGKGLISE